MENVTNELKLSIEELEQEAQKENALFVGIRNSAYNNVLVRNHTIKLTRVDRSEYHAINIATGQRGYVSTDDLLELVTSKEKMDVYIASNKEKIEKALALIGASVKVKNYQTGSFAEKSQTRLYNFVTNHENEIKGVIVGYDIPRDNFFVAFDIFENIRIPYDVASVLHSANRSYVKATCITYENTENLFNDTLEIDTTEPLHEIIEDSRGYAIDKTFYKTAVLGYAKTSYEGQAYVKTRIFLSPLEARRNNYKKCKKCGKYHVTSNIFAINSNNYCADCCKIMERENRIKRCEICGRYERINNLTDVTKTDGTSISICEMCAGRYLRKCEECGKTHFVYEQGNFARFTDNRGGSHYFCNECIDTTEKLTTCAGCGETIYKSDSDYYNNIIDGQYYCKVCYNEIQTRYRINSYHFKSEWNPQKLENEDNPIYYGFELETENRRNATTEYLKKLHDTLPYIVFERDGSLYSSGAFEMISEPLSMEFIKAHKDNVKSLLQQMEEYGATSHDTTTCGLHIHFTRSFFNEEAENKIITIFERFQNELIRFSRRKYSEIMHWTKFNGTDLKNIDVENVKKIKSAYLGNRYNCINLTNRKTIECRLFRGTLKFETFMACFELLDNIIAYVLNENEEKINKCKFIDILKYKPTEFLIDYCRTRNIIENNEEGGM